MNLRPGRISFQDLGSRKDKDFLVEYAPMAVLATVKEVAAFHDVISTVCILTPSSLSF